MPEPTDKSKQVTLEELLRLKRHERPGPEYWARFDREMNARVWRTLVEPPKSRFAWFGGMLKGRARWATVATVSLGAFVLSMATVPTTSTARGPKIIQNFQTASAAAAKLTPKSDDNQPVPAASAVLVESKPVAEPAKPEIQYATTAVDSSLNPSTAGKIPASVAFSAENGNGVKYATTSLSGAVFALQAAQSAY